MSQLTETAIVAIGRNESWRLLQSLSTLPKNAKILYVDSASTDGSVEKIRTHFPYISTVALSSKELLCAALARNRGAEAAIDKWPDTKFLQFLDADCKLEDSWLDKAKNYLESHPNVSAVCGYRVEENPNATCFNKICHLEWDRKLGKIQSCGGDFLIRTEAFKEVNGFREFFLAGEEADFFARLSLVGHSLERIDSPMTIHDANIQTWSQWVKRATRNGFAVALGAKFYPLVIRNHSRLKVIKTFLWVFVVPFILLLGENGVIAATALYILNYLSSFRYEMFQRRIGFKNSLQYAFFNLISKWPEAIGIIKGISRKPTEYDFSIASYRKN